MTEESTRPLKVFLCHASGDKPAVRALYQRLLRDGVDAWLDKEKLLPGQDWQLEIPKAVRESDVVVICLSNKSTTKEGYVQKEIKFALDFATEKPEGTIFLIPARLEECAVPAQLGLWQWVDLFETDGYERLMRSLRLRADKLGLRVGDTIYTDREVEQRLDQLYTEGLAALWVEDWDKAYRRFQAILREKPDHLQAIAKLDEAKRQKYLSDLYMQAMDAQKSENWPTAVKILEKLTSETTDYRDASSLLKTAQKKNQLTRLYEEARRLYQAKQWQAVVKVFAQIAAIEPNYQDPDNLLSSAEKEVAELQRLTQLNELYSRAVREMDAGNWYEARGLLEQVHKAQTGFLETERLLRKIENEITKIEELKRRNIQTNTLYEQAHSLVRSKNWREALGKIEEIHGVDPQFEDRDGIADKAKAGLELEEQEIQKRNQLAAMYAEAVRLLREGKYKEALDKWQEVKAIDPKYPDRQKVGVITRKQLAVLASSSQLRPLLIKAKMIWMGVAGLVIFISIIIILILSNRPGGNTASVSSSIPTSNPSSTSAPTTTQLPITTTSTITLPPIVYKTGSCLPSNWSVVGEGSWTCNGNIIIAHTTSGDGMLLSDAIYTDVYFEAVISTQNREASIAVRMQDVNNGYTIVLVPDKTSYTSYGDGVLNIIKRINGEEITLNSYHSAIFPKAGDPATLAVKVSGFSIQVYLNGRNVLAAFDSTFENGKIGLRIFGDSSAPCDSTFTNLSVK